MGTIIVCVFMKVLCICKGFFYGNLMHLTFMRISHTERGLIDKASGESATSELPVFFFSLIVSNKLARLVSRVYDVFGFLRDGLTRHHCPPRMRSA